MNTPQFINRGSMIADKEYIKRLSDVKIRFRQSQVKASVRVNLAEEILKALYHFNFLAIISSKHRE